MVKPKKGKREWYTILAPSYFGNKKIGETLAYDPKYVVGRKFTVSAMDLVNDISKYYLKLTFLITEVDGKVAKTEFDGSECLQDYIARMVIRRVARVDVVQNLVTKDGKKIRVKSLAILARKPSRAVKREVRKRIKDEIENIMKECTLADFVMGMLDERWKKKLSKEIRKIYPLKNFEIRKTEVLKS